jgi:hypothetical protein
VIGRIDEECKTGRVGGGGELAWLLEGLRVIRKHRTCDARVIAMIDNDFWIASICFSD